MGIFNSLNKNKDILNQNINDKNIFESNYK